MKDAVISTFKVPMVYVVLLAVIARSFHIPIWPPALSAIDMLGAPTSVNSMLLAIE